MVDLHPQPHIGGPTEGFFERSAISGVTPRLPLMTL
jgi:hypothetical protein